MEEVVVIVEICQGAVPPDGPDDAVVLGSRGDEVRLIGRDAGPSEIVGQAVFVNLVDCQI